MPFSGKKQKNKKTTKKEGLNYVVLNLFFFFYSSLEKKEVNMGCFDSGRPYNEGTWSKLSRTDEIWKEEKLRRPS